MNDKNKELSQISLPRPILFTAVFLSGAASLTYEIVILRLASLIYGSAVPAVALVTACFLGGLALGSFCYSRYISDKTVNPGKTYGLIQVMIGFFSICCFLAVRWIGIPHTGFFSEYLVVIFCILLPSVLMGALFPAAIQAGPPQKELKKKRLPVAVYAFETAGGVTGILCTAFILIGSIGILNTVICTSLLNLAIGIISLIKGQTSRTSESVQRFVFPVYSVSIFAFVSGLASLLYEMVWARTLSLYLYNNIYGFAIVLAGFLSGVCIGTMSFFLFSGKKNTLFLFWISQALLAVTASLFIPGLRILYPLLNLSGFSVTGMILSGFFFSAIPVIFSGFSFSALLKYASEQADHSENPSGIVYGVNTAGGIIGSLTAGFILIPVIGSSATVLAAAGINVFSAAFAARMSGFKKYPAVLSVLILCCVSVLAGHYKAVPPSVEEILADGGKLLFRQETRGGTVTVAQASKPVNLKVCFVDQNSVISNLYDNLKTVGLLGHLPFVLRGDIQSCFVIGFGTGVTVRSVLSHPVKRVICAEICEGVIQCAPYFSELNKGVQSDPRLELRINDGRRILRKIENKVDAIICDPVHPRLGSNSLYTIDFYNLCISRLNPGGIFVQYLPFHDMPPESFKTILRTFTEAFPNSSLWFGASHAVLAGIAGSDLPDYRRIPALYEDTEIRMDLLKSALSDIPTFIGCYIGNAEVMKHFAGPGSVNSDLSPLVEFSGVGPRDWTEQENMMSSAAMAQLITDYFTDIPESAMEQVSRSRRSVFHKMRARALQVAGLPEKALEQLVLAEQFNPKDLEIRIFRYEISRTSNIEP